MSRARAQVATVQADKRHRKITGHLRRMLHLSGGLLNVADVEVLVAVPGQCRSLAHLNLSANSIGSWESWKDCEVPGNAGRLLI